MTDGPTVPAGWYPAPGDPTSERYWDGRAWTADFRPVGETAPPPPPPPAPPLPLPPSGPRYDSTTQPVALPTAVPIYKRRGVQIAVGAFLVVGLIGSLLEEDTTASSSGDPSAATAAPRQTPDPVPAPSRRVPAEQEAFVALIREYEDRYDTAETDLQRANVRVQRRQALCDLIPDRTVTDWVGEVDTIGGNSDGDAYLDIEIADDIHIGTWNNRLSDLFDDTLVLATDPLYDTLLALRVGERVTFSGEFMSTSDECLRTSNLTEAFDMSRPDFKFKFSAVSPN